jgi:hypothetical protein
MKECTIYIDAPEKLLKGAGIPNSQFIPSNIFKIKIILRNDSSSQRLCSFSAALGNGIRYLENMKHEGPDINLLDTVSAVEPCNLLNNDNVIIFGNNFNLSPNSTNIISFDAALCDKYTVNSIENSGEKIAHRNKINFYAHLINEDKIDSCFVASKAMDFDLSAKCDDEKVNAGDITKYYVHLCTGQYDLARKVYLRSILDAGLEYIENSCNLEPNNVYEFNGKTIIKWDVGSLQPSETKRIGYKVRVKNNVKAGTLTNKLNSNCINNSAYTQCPVSCKYLLTVI